MTTLTRRGFAKSAIAAPVAAASLATTATSTSAGGHAAAPPALYGAPLGSYTITSILDGIAPLGRQFFFGPDPAEIDAAATEAGVGPDLLPAPVSAFLLRSDNRTILVDAGMGDLDILGPGFGRLDAGLAAAGVAPAEVDTVIITHAHPDHIGGMLADGAPAFNNAEVVIAEAEAGFWTDAGIQAQAPEEAQGLFALVQGTLDAYGDQVTQVGAGAEVAPGITLSISAGHTPGHAHLMVDGGERQLLIVADSMHSADLHTAIPEIGFGFDVDPGLAAESRRAMFDKVSADKMLIAGSHIHFPGFGRVLKSGDAFRYAPATWL
ncbi:MAG: MBL fold metallo-hydrolase [Pseudomonadota bacterium]